MLRSFRLPGRRGPGCSKPGCSKGTVCYEASGFPAGRKPAATRPVASARTKLPETGPFRAPGPNPVCSKGTVCYEACGSRPVSTTWQHTHTHTHKNQQHGNTHTPRSCMIAALDGKNKRNSHPPCHPRHIVATGRGGDEGNHHNAVEQQCSGGGKGVAGMSCDYCFPPRPHLVLAESGHTRVHECSHVALVPFSFSHRR